LFDAVVDFARDNATWGADDALVVAMMSGLLIIVYAVRRVRELENEISARRTAEQEAFALARHDTLTGLPNRHYFLEKLEEATAEAQLGGPTAVLLMDLDNFKPINDTYGHPAGDQVLVG